jgi:flagellar capping protein FliD
VSTSATSSTTSGTLGNAPPVSFPGISSGIDYDSIIEKYTEDTLQQEKPTQTQINNLNSQNTAVLKIQNLIGAVQDSLTDLSDPTIFGAYKATVANTTAGSSAATATQISGQNPVAGSYTINAQTVATATAITNDPAANGTINPATALAAAGTAIVPSNGTGSNGLFTINGQQFAYDVTQDSLNTIQTKLQAALTASGGGTATIVGNTIQLTGVTSLGSGGDSGNLEQVLKLDTAQISGGNVTSSSSISGIDESVALNTDSNAGFATAVTGGTFTINGVQFTVDPTKNALSDLITDINASAAGVTATFDSSDSTLTLTSNTDGPSSILLGASGDTSNFLSAVGLTTAGATKTVGTQASLTYTNSSGAHTVYSSTNDFDTAIPGIDLKITQSSPAGQTGTYYTVNVASDPSAAETAIGKFITAYNAAISTLDTDTQAPTVTAGTNASTGTSTSSSSGGGVLYGNFQISGLRDQLVNLVSGFVPTGSTSYNSLASVGILLDTASTSVGASDDDSSSSTSDNTSSANNSFTVNATSGKLAALDTTTFEAAYAANTSAVSALFTQQPTFVGNVANQQIAEGSDYGFAYQFGAVLANTDGITTFLKNSAVTPGDLSSVLLTSITDSNNQQIDSLEQQITLINNEATQQADSLRAQFSASESQIAQLQALQSQISSIGA